jgi:hypothetical protein
MNKKAIYYSLNSKITQSQLKKLKDVDLSKKEETNFLNYCKKYNIKALV